jgi:hypothetical protein
MDINLKPPKKCGDCNSKTQVGDKYVCIFYGGDTYGSVINIGTIPDWCPLQKLIERANNMPDENKRLFKQAYDGMKEMFELINNGREDQRDNN